ncbi:PTS lactose/cellobiose transporter subunit IIA [Erysipelothrix urinaevulpis]|uniref:PTS lactose/cellobiose transporter subunit IIA n=1 Tax=Erysipelothrix urinaevulpis TaxID=2683717 RepID=UPI001359169F|nr:PTS lactose/cellobiose transporter subunit IIA [Erysipelothrix urinaevulpis]
MEEKSFMLMGFAGSIKALSFDSFDAALDKDYTKAHELLAEADQLIAESSKVQKEILRGEESLTLLMVHAQDHIMTAIESRSMIEKLVQMMEVKERV